MTTNLATILDTVYALTSCCFPNPTIVVGKRRLRVVSLLGEGGFSFVYLAEDASNREIFALKKTRCSIGDHKAMSDVAHEINMYKLFSNNEHIIQLKDTHTVTEKDGTKSVYMFFPYYRKGNLQDNIDSNNISKTQFSEDVLLKFFLKICYALQNLHGYKAKHTSEQLNNTTITPYAHRDIKPGNILISDDGKSPILMDFGSITKARIPINTRQDGLFHQDIAAEYSTMPYRAPELYDIKTGSVLDEKVDIWSLGCTLYAAAYGQNPFEINANEMGGSIVLSVLNGSYNFPSKDIYSESFKELIKSMLTVNPQERPDVYQTTLKIETMLSTASECS